MATTTFAASPKPTLAPAELAAPAREESPAAEETTADHLFGDWNGVRTCLGERGWDFRVQYVGEFMANVSGGIREGGVYNGLLATEVDGDLEQALGWQGGLFHACGLWPHGRSLSEHFSGDLFAASNLDAQHTPRLFEFWLEQSFRDGQWSVRFGQLAADEEFAGTEQGGLFVNATFGWSPMFGLNAPAPIYPQGTPGVRLAWHPSERFYLQAGVYDGDPNPAAANGQQSNPHGVKFNFGEGALILAEAGLNWHLRTELPGSARLGGWHHTDTFYHLSEDGQGLSLADPASSGNPRELNGNWGIYFTAEQRLTREADGDSDQGLGVFTRMGFSLPDRSPLPLYWEGGVTYVGLVPGRDADTCGVAVAYGGFSRELRDMIADANDVNGTNDPLPDHEFVTETSYRAELRAGWAMQAGLQVLIHPGGSSAIDNAVLLYLRSDFDF